MARQQREVLIPGVGGAFSLAAAISAVLFCSSTFHGHNVRTGCDICCVLQAATQSMLKPLPFLQLMEENKLRLTIPGDSGRLH